MQKMNTKEIHHSFYSITLFQKSHFLTSQLYNNSCWILQ